MYHTERVGEVEVFLELVAEEVPGEGLHVAEALHRRVEEARVTQVVQACLPPDRANGRTDETRGARERGQTGVHAHTQEEQTGKRKENERMDERAKPRAEGKTDGAEVKQTKTLLDGS